MPDQTILIDAKIQNRIKLADNTGKFKNSSPNELETLVRRGLELFHEKGRDWGNLDGFGMNEEDFQAISALALYNLATDEENYK